MTRLTPEDEKEMREFADDSLTINGVLKHEEMHRLFKAFRDELDALRAENEAEKADHAKTLDAAEKAAEIATFRNASPVKERTVDMKLDAKFYGQIRKVKDDSVVPDDEYIVFLAKDNAFAAILPEYLDKCISLGCDPEQIAAVDRMIDRLRAWRAAHPERLKNPDAASEKLWEGK